MNVQEGEIWLQASKKGMQCDNTHSTEQEAKVHFQNAIQTTNIFHRKIYSRVFQRNREKLNARLKWLVKAC